MLTKEHVAFLKKLGVTVEDIINLSPEDSEKFIVDELVPYICGNGTAEEEDIADDIIDIINGDDGNCEPFLEARYHRPVCNHSLNDIGPENLGYATGVFVDGIPYEADLWMADGEKSVSVYIPDTDHISDDRTQVEIDMYEETNECVERHDNSVLKVGMSYDPDIDISPVPYVDYLERMGVISFGNCNRNGSVRLYTDIENNPVICINVTLESPEVGDAHVNLHFMDFPGVSRKRNPNLSVIKLDSDGISGEKSLVSVPGRS